MSLLPYYHLYDMIDCEVKSKSWKEGLKYKNKKKWGFEPFVRKVVFDDFYVLKI